MRRVAALISGALSGLGVIVLLQQYSVAYPTALLTIIGIVLGIGAQFAVMFLATRYAYAGSPPPVALTVTGDSGEQPETADPSTWVPTHRVSETGSDAWAAPDPATAPVAHLDPWLDVQVQQQQGDWAHIICENGWSAWVDARGLESRP